MGWKSSLRPTRTGTTVFLDNMAHAKGPTFERVWEMIDELEAHSPSRGLVAWGGFVGREGT